MGGDGVDRILTSPLWAAIDLASLTAPALHGTMMVRRERRLPTEEEAPINWKATSSGKIEALFRETQAEIEPLPRL